MTFVKDDDAVKIFSTPLEELFEPRFELATRRLSNKRGIRGENDALHYATVDASRDLSVFHFIQRMDSNLSGPDIPKISFSVIFQIAGDRQPKSLLPSLYLKKINEFFKNY